LAGEDALNVDRLTDAPATRLVVIGASAGGLAPLRTIVEALPPDFPAAVLAVIHVASTGTSVLPQILDRASHLEVLPADEAHEIRPGRLIVAPPDRHLVVEDGHVNTNRGPRENGHRPALDPLFRSAAAAYGPACCGVVLSGARDDGTAGLAEIKRQGGCTLVQDPAEALYPAMPSNALAGSAVDAVLPAAAIAAVLMQLAGGEQAFPREPLAAVVDSDPGPVYEGEVLTVTCPECGGVLTEREHAGLVRYTCHVGHAYAPRSLLADHAEGVERAMWTAARSLEDRATLLERMARRTAALGAERSAAQFERQARSAREEADTIRTAIAALDDAALAALEPGQEVAP
jgi:two-component system chemotaxis response regulator CheB